MLASKLWLADDLAMKYGHIALTKLYTEHKKKRNT